MAEISLEKSRGPFSCLSCSTEVLLHQGSIRKPYFRHKPSINPSSKCDAIHEAAIRLLILFLRFFGISRRCWNCQASFPVQKFTEKQTGKAEVPLLDGKYRADVFVESSIVLEVFYTHEIGTPKRHALLSAGYQVYEVSAQSVIDAYDSNSFQLTDLWSDWLCPLCREIWSSCKMIHAPCHGCRKQPAILTAQEALDKKLRIVSYNLQDRIGVSGISVADVLCSKCGQRPCLGCAKWQPMKVMKAIEAPPFTSKYPVAYVCPGCERPCTTCAKEPTAGGCCSKCQREAADFWRRHRGSLKCAWRYGTDPPTMAQMRTELFLLRQ